MKNSPKWNNVLIITFVAAAVSSVAFSQSALACSGTLCEPVCRTTRTEGGDSIVTCTTECRRVDCALIKRHQRATNGAHAPGSSAGALKTPSGGGGGGRR
jgi:hypothetical protein